MKKMVLLVRVVTPVSNLQKHQKSHPMQLTLQSFRCYAKSLQYVLLRNNHLLYTCHADTRYRHPQSRSSALITEAPSVHRMSHPCISVRTSRVSCSPGDDISHHYPPCDNLPSRAPIAACESSLYARGLRLSNLPHTHLCSI